MKTKDLKFRNEDIVLDETLEKFAGRNLFPEQLRKANEMLTRARLPEGFTSNPELNGRLDNQPFFPEKLARAKEFLAQAGLPDLKELRKR
ncbi:hypothetical protein [Dyadobacter sp.]|uniref:hypothetical protein n=1 Tax=Dyadobacter sp. TaxID=1914288 RepID=UPI003F6EF718